jgi:hypothetical protein
VIILQIFFICALEQIMKKTSITECNKLNILTFLLKVFNRFFKNRLFFKIKLKKGTKITSKKEIAASFIGIISFFTKQNI